MKEFLGIYDHLGLFEAYHCVPFVGRQILLRSFVSGLNTWTVVVFVFFVHEQYLVAVDMTSHVGTIPTWLASYFLV